MIATDSFRIVLPGDWELVDLGPPAVAHGPRGEEVMISASHLSGFSAEAAELRVAVAGLLVNLERAIRNAAAHPELRDVIPLTTATLSNGDTLLHMTSQSLDGAIVFAQFGLLHQFHALLATIESPQAAAESTEVLRQALTKTSWLRPH